MATGLPVVGIILAMAIGFVALGIILPTGLWTTASIQSIVSNWDLGATGNSTRTSLFNNIFQGFNLAAISPIVMAAGFIITLIIASFGAFTLSRRS